MSQRPAQRRIVPRAGGGAGNNGGNGLKPERDEVMARRRPAAGAAWKTRGVPPRQLAMAAPRRVFAASGPKGGASFSLSGRITMAIEVAQHLRAIFSTGEWLRKHAHMKIHEFIPMYIDKEEIVWPAGEPPNFTTLHGISAAYCFMMRGAGVAAF